MSRITTQDGTELYYKDWGSGQPVIFSHGWPLCSDSWEAQMFYLADHGYRCIAHGLGYTHKDQLNSDLLEFFPELIVLFHGCSPDRAETQQGTGKSSSESWQ